jgi:hypothetical protein
MNYIANDERFPTSITFEDGRVVAITHIGDDGNFAPNLAYLTVSPASEYPKPCGIYDGIIQSAADLDWHGYGNCREIPEALLNEMGLSHVIHDAPAPRWHSTEPFDVLYRDWYVKAQEATK